MRPSSTLESTADNLTSIGPRSLHYVATGGYPSLGRLARALPLGPVPQMLERVQDVVAARTQNLDAAARRAAESAQRWNEIGTDYHTEYHYR